jgi:hypothetical protein
MGRLERTLSASRKASRKWESAVTGSKAMVEVELGRGEFSEVRRVVAAGGQATGTNIDRFRV